MSADHADIISRCRPLVLYHWYNAVGRLIWYVYMYYVGRHRVSIYYAHLSQSVHRILRATCLTDVGKNTRDLWISVDVFVSRFVQAVRETTSLSLRRRHFSVQTCSSEYQSGEHVATHNITPDNHADSFFDKPWRISSLIIRPTKQFSTSPEP